MFDASCPPAFKDLVEDEQAPLLRTATDNSPKVDALPRVAISI